MVSYPYYRAQSKQPSNQTIPHTVQSEYYRPKAFVRIVNSRSRASDHRALCGPTHAVTIGLIGYFVRYCFIYFSIYVRPCQCLMRHIRVTTKGQSKDLALEKKRRLIHSIASAFPHFRNTIL